MRLASLRNDALVFASALLLRGVVLAQIVPSPFGRVLVGDGRQYDAWARMIAGGDWLGQGVFYQAPLYPYFLGLLYTLAGPELLAARVVQAILGSLACVAVYRAGRGLFGERAGLWAGGLLAVYAPAIYFDLLIQKTVLDAGLLCVLLLLLAMTAQRPRRRLLLALGGVLGLASLTRENALLLAPVLALWLGISLRRTERMGMASVGIFLLGLALPLLPVAIRNQVVGGEFALTTSQAGTNFYLGNNAYTDGRYMPLRPGRADARFERIDATELAEQTVGHSLRPSQVSSFWMGRAAEFMRTQPGDWVRLTLRKCRLLLSAGEVADTESIESWKDVSGLLRGLGWLFHFGTVAPLAALGLVLTWPERRRLWALYGVIVAMDASLVLFFVLARYRQPLVPVLLLFAGAAVARVRRTPRRTLGIGVAAAAAVALLAQLPFPYTEEQRALGYYSVGDALLDAGRADEAIPSLERAAAIAPGFRPARSRLGAAYAELGEARFAAGDLAGALSRYRRAAELEPDSAATQSNLGAALVGLGRDEEALGPLRRAVERRPALGLAQFNLGLALLRLGRLAEAAGPLDRAARLEPGNPGVFLVRGMLREAMGSREEAIQDYDRVLTLDPAQAEARARRDALRTTRVVAPD